MARLFLRIIRWDVAGEVPAGSYVMIAAPHTSNWDLPIMLAVAAMLGARISWMGKEQIFRWPFGELMRRLGGVPVRRDRSHNMVDQMIDLFGRSGQLILTVPPEGTRGRAEHWRSGFYYIALGAGVPVIPGYLDYSSRIGGVGAPIELSGDVTADMDAFRAFYTPIAGKRPEKQGRIELREEIDR
ncbi:MAG TPA: 1-acyl-sn-glycerol-3-phosphate acyltransferase [Acidimicrobiia bacterium]|nr:1-acyl-sn-glycerol-3-phosphate acyltransferase [Acidimicrobiia bacterium]